jgi:hypothetical protein
MTDFPASLYRCTLRANYSIKVILVLMPSYCARVTFCRSPQDQRNRLLPAHRETSNNKKTMGSRLIPLTRLWNKTSLSFMDSLARNTAWALPAQVLLLGCR